MYLKKIKDLYCVENTQKIKPLIKNLEVYLNDGTKVFECIVSNQTGIVKIHHNTLMKSMEQIIKSVIDGKYKIEFEDKVLDTSKADTIFDRIELFKNEENFQVIFDVVTPQKVLEYISKFKKINE